MKKIKDLINKYLNREMMMYIIFGVATTLVNLIISIVLESVLKVDGAIASAIGIIASVLFAYFTNRKWVFNTEVRGFIENIKEFGKFILGRAFTMIIEQGGVMIFYSNMNLPFIPVKLIFTIIVIILNFVISKLYVFTKKNS